MTENTIISPTTTEAEAADLIDTRLRQARSLLCYLGDDNTANAFNRDIAVSALWGVQDLIEDAIRFNDYIPEIRKKRGQV